METASQPESATAAETVVNASDTDNLSLPPTHEAVVAHSMALAILAVIALIFVLDWAQTFVISLLLGILFAYTLNPLVAWLEFIKIPRVIGASIVMLAVVSMVLLSAYALRGQMQTIVNQLPKAASKLSYAANQWRRGQLGNMQKVQIAANEIEKATNQVAATPGANRHAATYVVIDPSPFKLNTLLWTGWRGVLAFFGQAIMVAFLTYFLLLSGDTFKRKLVRLAGPTLTRKKITVHILDDINNSIQNYMFMLLITNALVGVLTWAAFTWLGLENAGAWAVAASLLHIVPYFGPAITAGVTGMAAFIQFDSLSSALQVAGASLLIATLIGTLVTTWMTGRFAKMNTAAVFISLLFWTWLWGVWGMLLSIPIIVIVRVVSQHIEQLHPVAELLGD
ncbi:AI-2E family transporter [Sulfuriferula plumbiphila]|uniref:AI-2E family transporter n=1 Tax=Sulfuriferula plumbiphila TaxID=171865 RepID=A0A512L6F0_9PROT|nr:AI-2E family transporter [Sulfuriferula plumbiphila]BBP03621.1 AI-2E family transporter [Sulfuriferula plumbiphila]GEP30022.1 AI-2E family transporter [Sulfuriferula plumbiphila]